MSSSSTPEKKLTEEERRQIDLQRRDFFKGTIAIIVIYGAFILGMSILGIVSEASKVALFVNGFPFTVTFMAGTIFVIILLLIQIFSYGSTPPPVAFAGENMSCPDYWVLKKTPDNQLVNITNSQARALSTYYCENPNDARLATDIQVPAFVSGEEKKIGKLRDVANTYNTGTIDQQYHMQCNRLYPDYMAYIDKTEFKDSPTTLRCHYLSQCKNTDATPTGQGANARTVPWTGVCPNPA